MAVTQDPLTRAEDTTAYCVHQDKGEDEEAGDEGYPSEVRFTWSDSNPAVIGI